MNRSKGFFKDFFLPAKNVKVAEGKYSSTGYGASRRPLGIEAIRAWPKGAIRSSCRPAGAIPAAPNPEIECQGTHLIIEMGNSNSRKGIGM